MAKMTMNKTAEASPALDGTSETKIQLSPYDSRSPATTHVEPKNQRRTARLVVLFAAMAVAVFCGGLVRSNLGIYNKTRTCRNVMLIHYIHKQDANVVAPAVPSITNSLGGSEDEGWYGTA